MSANLGRAEAQRRFGVRDGEVDLRALRPKPAERPPSSGEPAPAARWPDMGQGVRSAGTTPWANDGEREAIERFGTDPEERQEAKDFRPPAPAALPSPALERELRRDASLRFLRQQ
jgi:hypothetical protein